MLYKKRSRKTFDLFCTLAVTLSLLMVGCVPLSSEQPVSPLPEPPKEVPFETLILTDFRDVTDDGTYEGEEPWAHFISSQEDIQQLTPYLPPEILAKINVIPFEDKNAIILFHGWAPSTGYDAEINRVMLQSDQFHIRATLTRPGEELGVSDSETSPYHIVTIEKQAVSISKPMLVLQTVEAIREP